MYGKIFDTMYDGTLYGKWEAMVTFQQMIVLCDADGTIDMTPMAISARTGIPREIIDKGIEALEAPDPYTRTPGSDGRRILRLDDHRPWGWSIVNHSKYKGLRDAEEVRAQNRERKRKQREREGSQMSRDVTQCHTMSRHTDTDTDTVKKGQKAPPLTHRFEDFWTVYPKKRKKKTAKEIWCRKKLSHKADTLIADIENRKLRDQQWKDGYVPDPTTYLNQERWDDELAPAVITTPIKHRQPEVITEEQRQRDREKAERELAILQGKNR